MNGSGERIEICQKLSKSWAHWSTPMYWAALKGHMGIIKLLAPLTHNPNAPNNYSQTPSSVATNLETFQQSMKIC